MSDDPQAEQSDLIPVRYVGAEGLIVNGQGIAPGDIVHLPPAEVAQWPDPHPYYERADEARGERRKASEDVEAPASAAGARTARTAPAVSEEEAALPAAEPTS